MKKTIYITEDEYGQYSLFDDVDQVIGDFAYRVNISEKTVTRWMNIQKEYYAMQSELNKRKLGRRVYRKSKKKTL